MGFIEMKSIQLYKILRDYRYYGERGLPWIRFKDSMQQDAIASINRERSEIE